MKNTQRILDKKAETKNHSAISITMQMTNSLNLRDLRENTAADL